MKRIGVLGGTFDPIHIGHLCMAYAALDQVKLDRIIFIPSYWPPHKNKAHVSAAADRLAMVKAAVRREKLFDVSDFEIKAKGKSYSINTIKHLKQTNKNRDKYFFIIGADSYESLSKWYKVDELIKLTNFVVVNRPNVKIDKSKFKSNFISMPNLDIASSDIRKMIKQGRNVSCIVPASVVSTIRKRKLYL